MTTGHRARPHLPGRAAIDAYGNGGFRFAGLSHRGSLLCLPSGVYAWPVTAFEDISEDALAAVFHEREDGAEFLLLGTGKALRPVSEALRWACRAKRISLDVMDTGSAARTYNIMLAEARPVAAALIAVD